MSQPQVHKHSQSGFTLLEMIITLIVLAVLVSMAMPGMSEFGVKQKFIGTAEQVFGHLQQTRSEAIARSTNAVTSFSVDGTSTWSYGFSTNPVCNPTVTIVTAAGACVIVVDDADADGLDPGDGSVDEDDLVLMRFTNADYAGNKAVAMTVSGLGGGSNFVFDSVRGTLTPAAGQVDLVSSTGLLLRIEVSALGRVAICSPDGSVPNYGVC